MERRHPAMTLGKYVEHPEPSKCPEDSPWLLLQPESCTRGWPPQVHKRQLLQGQGQGQDRGKSRLHVRSSHESKCPIIPPHGR
eukprot:6464478-Amphidinium_carterae.2